MVVLIWLHVLYKLLGEILIKSKDCNTYNLISREDSFMLNKKQCIMNCDIELNTSSINNSRQMKQVYNNYKEKEYLLITKKLLQINT